MAGCSDDAVDDPAEETEENSQAFSYSIDPELEPSRAEHPRPGETTAPLVAIETPVGVAELVANEILVQPRDEEQLEQIKAQLDAEVVAKLSARGDGAMPLYALSFDSDNTSLDTFVDDVRAVSAGGENMGHVAFSSEEGARTMATAAKLHRQGIPVDLTWVGKPTSINTMSSIEAPTGWQLSGGGNLGDDAYDWPYFSATSTQGTGVGEAWTILERSGRLDNTVRVAVLDAGFCPNDDYYDSVIYDVALGMEDVASAVVPVGFTPDACSWSDWSDLSTDGWHGTHVYSAMMGRHDNGFGSTGPASPVVQTPTIMAHMMYDTVTTLIALDMVASDGAQIVNMSYHIPVPWGLQWTHGAYNDAMGSYFSGDGLLMFAAAGNEGDDVDEHWTPGGVDMGEAWQHLPCEANGVICVAGLAHDSTALAGNSNFGADSVDIAGPYIVAGGPDSDEPDNAAATIAGTSFASPYVAGVAALIWAADPGLSATEVRDTLYRTSLEGDYDDEVRNGYACALCAIRSLVPNTSPAIDLVSPQAGAAIPEGEEINFEVSVSDVEDDLVGDTTQITWFEGDQEIHQGASFSEYLCPGTHTLRVEAVDSDGASTTMEFEVESVAAEMNVTIGGPRLRDYRVHRDNDGNLYTDDVQLAASATLPTCTDPDSTNVNQNELTWRDETGSLLGTGSNLTVSASMLQDEYGDFISKEIEVKFTQDSQDYGDEIILSPCTTPDSGVDSYADCSTSAIIGDMLESLSEALGDGAWDDPERQADLIVDDLYRDSLVSLGVCPDEECDPTFPRLTDPIMGDLWGSYGESSVYGIEQMLEAAQAGDPALFDEATAQARDALGRMGNMPQKDKELLQRGIVVGAALADFYLPESEGGQNGWSEMTFVTNPDTMSPAQAMRPVEAGFRGFLDATIITDDPTSDLTVEAAEYSSLQEAIVVTDELP